MEIFYAFLFPKSLDFLSFSVFFSFARLKCFFVSVLILFNLWMDFSFLWVFSDEKMCLIA